jgi:Uncharacterized protein conserved in bacteria (DUF2064)
MRAALNQGIKRLESSSSSSSSSSNNRRAASLVVGSDIPDLQPSDVLEAVDAVVESEKERTTTTAKTTTSDCVLGPAADGGFWIVGVGSRCCGSSLLPEGLFEVRFFSFCSLCVSLFQIEIFSFSIQKKHTQKKHSKQGITWSTPTVFSSAASSVASCGLRLAPKETLRVLADVDTVDDLVNWWEQRRQRSGNDDDGSSSRSNLASVVEEVLELAKKKA